MEVEKTSSTSSWRSSRPGILAVACLAVFIDMILYGIVIPIQPRLLTSSGVPDSSLDIHQAILLASYALGMLVSTPIFGVLSDRTGNRQIPMLLGLAALAISTVSFAFVRTFALLVVARVIQGVSGAATWVVGLAMVADAYPSDDGLGFAIGIVWSFHTVGGFLGPLVGGFFGEYYGLPYPFLLCAALSVVDLIARLVIKPPPPRRNTGRTTKRIGILTIVRNRKIFLTLIAILVYSGAFSAIELFVALWLEQDWGYSESKTSLFMLAFILPNIIMGILIGWMSDRVPRHKIIAAGLLLHGLAAPLIPLSKNVVSLLIFSMLFGITSPIIGTPSTPLLITLVEQQLGGTSYAQVYAVFNMTYSCGMILGPWIVGVIKASHGFAWGMMVISVVSVVFSPIFWFGCSVDLSREPVKNGEEHLLTDVIPQETA
jgi:multidrug resistance protein